MPSHPMTTNSSSFRQLIVTSGMAKNRKDLYINHRNPLQFLPVTICLWSGASKFCLKKKSPNARDIASAPLTRLKSTQPPPSMMRLSSSFRFGLWSNDNGQQWPLNEAIARESPILPCPLIMDLLSTLHQAFYLRNRDFCRPTGPWSPLNPMTLRLFGRWADQSVWILRHRPVRNPVSWRMWIRRSSDASSP